jgi:hypothetical protein
MFCENEQYKHISTNKCLTQKWKDEKGQQGVLLLDRIHLRFPPVI